MRRLFLLLLPLGLWGEGKGALALYHFSIENQRPEDSGFGTALGAYRSVDTKTHGGVSYRLRLDLSQPVGDSRNREMTGLFTDEGGPLGVLTELFIRLKRAHWEVRAGPQRLDTPLANDDTTRFVPYSYEALRARYLGHYLTADMGYIHRTRSNTAQRYDTATVAGEIPGGVQFAALGFAPDLPVGGHVYLYQSDRLFDALHGELRYRYERQKSGWHAGLQYIATRSNHQSPNLTPLRECAGDDVDIRAGRLGLFAGGFDATLAYSVNEGDDGIGKGYGGLTDLYTTAMISCGKNRYGPETSQLRLGYALSEAWSTHAIFTRTRFRLPEGNDYTGSYADLRYHRLPWELFIRFERLDRALPGSDTDYFRLICRYDY